MRLLPLNVTAKTGLAVSAILLVAQATAFLMLAHSYEDQARQQLSAHQAVLATRIAEDLDLRLATIHRALIALASVADGPAIADSDTAQRFLDANADLLALFDRSIFVFGPSGTLIAESPFRPNRRGQNFGFRDYIRKTIATGRGVISDPFITTKTDKNAVLMFTAPVIRHGHIVAILGGSLGLSQPGVLGKIQKMRIGQSGYVSIATADGTIVMHPNPKRIMQKLSSAASPVLRLAMGGFIGTTESVNSDGVATLSSLRKIPSTGWLLGVHYPISEAYAPVRTMTSRWFAIMFTTVIALIALTWLAIWYLTRPLTAITQQISRRSASGGSLLPIETSKNDEVGRLAEAFNRFIDLQNEKQQALTDSERRFRLLAEHSTDMISRHSADGVFFYASPACKEILDYDQFDIENHSILEYVHPDDQDHVRQTLTDCVQTGAPTTAIYRFRRRNYQYIWCETSAKCVSASGERLEVTCVTRDISARKAMEDDLSFLAQHDSLTGLANRLSLQTRFDQASMHSSNENSGMAVLMLDLDRFKYVNDTLGHHAGDAMLKLVADRLLKCVRKSDTVSRPGGDEFVVLLSNIGSVSAVSCVLHKIMEALVDPFLISGQELHTSVSMGVSLYPTDGTDLQTLMKHADTAMYQAKAAGGQQHRYYEEHMNQRNLRHLAIESALHGAIERGEMFLEFQPKIEMMTRAVTGSEALLRWNNPQLGPVAPAEFIPIAEACGLIVPIGEWVIRTAFAQNVAWREAGLPSISIAVNVSPRQFRQPGLLQTLRDALAETRMDPALCEIELTEGVVMENPERSAALLREIRALGASIAIDDFGTGYSSLNYLKRFSLNTLKIDRSFVRDIDFDKNDESIVAGVISLAHALGLKVVAEGVETQNQASFLRAEKCDEMQGYLFSRPLIAAHMAQFLRDQGTISKFATQIEFFPDHTTTHPVH